ncbi:MAG: toll/interleukin-1 receptor domain-containing protein [Pseudomonadota bacterium]
MSRLGGVVDLLFGYDFFISYAHADGVAYPRQLADELERLGFSVFLDERVYVAGDDIRAATRRRVRMSKKLVVVVREHVLDSFWVGKEIETSLDAGGDTIAIDVGGTLANATEDNPIRQQLNDRIYVSEGSDTPSESVVTQLARSFQSTRQETVRTRFFASAAAIFLCVAIVAVWQFREARANAIQFYEFCDLARSQVVDGFAKLDRLGEGTEFGTLVSNIARQVANLPDPKSLECGDDPR